MNQPFLNLEDLQTPEVQCQLCRSADDGEVLAQSIWVTTTFVAFHYWKNAPDAVAFLRQPHRHVFHVKVSSGVSHSDRDVEFFTLKRDLEELLSRFVGTTSSLSCEQWCHVIRGQLHHMYDYQSIFEVEVSEDGENGAKVYFDVEPFER